MRGKVITVEADPLGEEDAHRMYEDRACRAMIRRRRTGETNGQHVQGARSRVDGGTQRNLINQSSIEEEPIADLVWRENAGEGSACENRIDNRSPAEDDLRPVLERGRNDPERNRSIFDRCVGELACDETPERVR